jgi:Cu/Ag efflux pump CusA
MLAFSHVVGWHFATLHYYRESLCGLCCKQPFSLIGSVLAIAVTGIGISLGTVVGLVTVFGVSALGVVIRGANERLVPILMTATVTVLGGLLSSTLLNLFVLPALAHRYVRIRQEAPGREALQPAQ